MNHARALLCLISFVFAIGFANCSSCNDDGGESEPQPWGTECMGDSGCNDRLFCNGDEVCVRGRCEPGTPPCIEDDVDFCNEETDKCDWEPPDEDDDDDTGDDGPWTWIDPPSDLISWKFKADPIYVGHLDIVSYGISLTDDGFDAHITTVEDLPGSTDSGFHEYYAVFDANASWPNFLEAGDSPTGGGDTAYIAQFLEGNWKMFFFQYLPSGGWTSQSTSSTVEVSGDTLVMHIDNVEAGIQDSQSVDVHMTTWYKEGDVTSVGDDSDVEQFTYSDAKGYR
jgi:hypothetical protein